MQQKHVQTQENCNRLLARQHIHQKLLTLVISYLRVIYYCTHNQRINMHKYETTMSTLRKK